ncbi:MAG TPA: serine hydrolase domain-containing protein [Acidimicrobiales bacterium]|nr:serine hydrolase domain-containing protein [Acidimicrobiales bacterium]
MEVPISGECAPPYESVRDAFVGNFVDRGEVGAAVCVIDDREVVVDLVGGWADAHRTRHWQLDTICDFYSVGKALLGLLLLRQVDTGAVGLDDPIGDVWPEFANRGKEHATIRHALCHRAGVPAIREPLTDDDLFDWSVMTAALARTPAWFEPGSRHVYHTNTYGHLIGELVHRTSGSMPGAALAELARPLDADVHFGVPAAEQHRCAELLWSPNQEIPEWSPDELGRLTGDTAMIAKSYFNPPGYASIGVVNSPEWRASQIGSTSGHGSARGIARIYAALGEADRLLSEDLLAEATRPQSIGPCPVLGEEVTFGLGFNPTTERRPLGPNSGAFGHFGTGGALGFCDRKGRIAFGYVMNRVIPRWQSKCNRALIDAVYAEL